MRRIEASNSNELLPFAPASMQNSPLFAPIPAPQPEFRVANSHLPNAHMELITAARGFKPEEGTVEWNTPLASRWYASWLNPNVCRETGNDVFKDQWVRGHRNAINAAAEKYNIPPVLLAGVAYVEVGGMPFWFDRATFDVRRHPIVQRIAPHVPSGYIQNQLTRQYDHTSFGHTSVQMATAAEVLGYDFNNLTMAQRRAIAESLEDPAQSIFIAASYLSHLRNNAFPGVSAEDMTLDQISALASWYNVGPGDSSRANGNRILARLDRLMELLED